MPESPDRSSSEDEREHSIEREIQASRGKPSQTRVAPIDDPISAAETNTNRSRSPTPSHQSDTATQKSFDAVSISTTASTNVTTGTTATTNAADTKPQTPGSIPIIRPPVLPSPAPQQVRPANTNPSTQQQVQGAVGGNTSNQTKPQAQTQFHPGPQQQTQFSNQIPANQVYNELLGPDAFKDVTLNIDYGAVDAYNIGIQEPYTVPNPSVAGGQGHGGNFDITKALFNQVDTNRDGTISREEFEQWAKRGTQSYGGQTSGNYQAANGQGKVTEYQASASYGNNFSIGQLFDGAPPDIANILRQSGLNG